MIPRTKSKVLLSISLLILGLLAISGQNIAPAHAGSLRQSATEGAQLFQQYCQACHSIGQGDLVGPDLQGVTQRRDINWLVNFITQPDQVLASGDVTANTLLGQYGVPMPNLGITEGQAQSLIAYLEAPDGAAAPPPAPPLPAGQAAAGQALFTGKTPLTNGGVPCMACHSAVGVGAAGGGVLGPDLTNVNTRLGSAGLTSALQTLPFPTMQGIFNTRPLTSQEQADLLTFFQQTDQQTVVSSAMNNTLLWGIGIGGALILFGAMLAFWPRQRQSISARLRQTASIPRQ